LSRTIQVISQLDNFFCAAAQKVVEIVACCREEGRVCSVALAGGSTPRGLYQLLTEQPYESKMAWSHLQIFWGDERQVPPDHQDSNFRMAQEALLSQVPIPPQQVFRIEGERPPDEAAMRYEEVLREQFGAMNGEIPRFDLILLGMGADGHTASLFPGTTAVEESTTLVAATWVEKLHTHRVTMTPPVLNAAKDVIFLIRGHDKASALQMVLEGPRDPARYPAQVVQPTDGHVLWLIDSEAAHDLSETTLTHSSTL
jgi:6-phosphogluconolactonase